MMYSSVMMIIIIIMMVFIVISLNVSDSQPSYDRVTPSCVVIGFPCSVWGTHWDRRNSSASTAFSSSYMV